MIFGAEFCKIHSQPAGEADPVPGRFRAGIASRQREGYADAKARSASAKPSMNMPAASIVQPASCTRPPSERDIDDQFEQQQPAQGACKRGQIPIAFDCAARSSVVADPRARSGIKSAQAKARRHEQDNNSPRARALTRAAAQGRGQDGGQLNEAFDIEFAWEEDVLRFRHSSVEGQLAVRRREVVIEAQLSLVLALMQIEHREFDTPVP